MQPVVNRLQIEYNDKIEFREINADTSEGFELFNYFRLPGHPSYVLLNPIGKILWQGLGEQPEEVIRSDLEKVLSE